MRKVQSALGLVLLMLLLPVASHLRKTATLSDFKVYYTAALLARGHGGAAIYDGADTGVDPQFRFAAPGSRFARAAASAGVGETRLYVYPPTLADLLIPLTGLSLGNASRLWMALNYGCVLAGAWLIVQLVRVPVWSVAGTVVLLGVATAVPTSLALYWGQITLFLLVLWGLGIACYARGWRTASAMVLALATAIKLTPVLIVLPLLLWRDWRWLRGFAGALLAVLLATVAINSPGALVDYVRHVLPGMSGGFAHAENSSIASAAQIVWIAAHGGSLATLTMPVPPGVLTGAKGLSVALLLAAAVPVARLGPAMTTPDRVLTLALFAMLTTPLSPVSWLHAYVVSLVGLCLLWAEALRCPISNGWLVMLTLCTIELTSFTSRFLDLPAFSGSRHEVGVALMFCLIPAATLVLVLGRLYRMPMRTV